MFLGDKTYKKTILGLSAAVVIIIIIFALIVIVKQPSKDIEVTIVKINYENEKFYLNISLKNNQDQIGWISDTYLVTIDGNHISLTGGGIDKKINSGEKFELSLFSANAYYSITDPPLELAYTVFPSGNSYFVRI